MIEYYTYNPALEKPFSPIRLMTMAESDGMTYSAYFYNSYGMTPIVSAYTLEIAVRSARELWKRGLRDHLVRGTGMNK